MARVSPAFEQAVGLTISRLIPTASNPGIPDDSIVFMLTGWGIEEEQVPIYLLPKVDPRQAAAGGCPHCEYLGLWADYWPGYPPTKHGSIFLYEEGIMRLVERGRLASTVSPPFSEREYLADFILDVANTHGPLVGNICDVLVHELSHALQRDHVLDAMEAIAQGRPAAAVYHPQEASCNVCPGHG